MRVAGTAGVKGSAAVCMPVAGVMATAFSCMGASGGLPRLATFLSS
jgi:hypothetical protein